MSKILKWWRNFAMVFAVAVLSNAVGMVALGGATSAVPISSYVCSGAQITLFDNSNGSPVTSGAAAPTFSTNGKAYCLTYIQTYHWNDGHGAAPGHLSLIRISTSPPGLPRHTSYFSSKTSSGQNNVPNVNHYVDVPISPPVILDGTYQCADTVAASWSGNSASGGKGFCIVYADPAVPPSGGATTTTAAPTANQSHSSNGSIWLLVLLGFAIFIGIYLAIRRRQDDDNSDGDNNGDVGDEGDDGDDDLGPAPIQYLSTDATFDTTPEEVHGVVNVSGDSSGPPDDVM